MSRNKFNLKDKKTKIIISVIVLCIILLGGLGFGLATLNSTESKDIAYNKDKADKNNKVDKNKTENKKEENKKEENKKEESKKEETKVETSSTSTTTSAVENKSEGNKGTSNSNTSTGSSSSNSSSSSSNSNTSSGSSSSSSNSGVSNNGGSSSSNSGSSNSNSGAVSTPSTPSKPSTGSSSSGSSSSGNTAKPEAHSHSWNPITTTVHHDETGHWEDVLIQEAWSEYIPVYDEQAREICNGCGADITSDPYTHNENHMLNGEAGGWTTEYVQVQVGTEEIKHGPVYDMKYVVDTPAWDETVTTGYQCSCGATK